MPFSLIWGTVKMPSRYAENPWIATRHSREMNAATAGLHEKELLIELFLSIVAEFVMAMNTVFHPVRSRARTSFENCWLRGATDPGAEPQ